MVLTLLLTVHSQLLWAIVSAGVEALKIVCRHHALQLNLVHLESQIEVVHAVSVGC